MNGDIELVNDIRQTIVRAIDTHLHVLRRLVDIEDIDLRRIIDRLSANLRDLANEATSKEGIPLRLDELFLEVTSLIETANKIDAVDIEVNRWEIDNRAIRYFAANRRALERGAKLRRIYVVSPAVTAEGFESLMQTMLEHDRLNDEPTISQNGGRIEICAIHFKDVPRECRGKDFAIFDDRKVLLESFDDRWQTTHEGRFSINSLEIDEYKNIFSKMWNKSTPITRLDGDQSERASQWKNEILERIAKIRNSFEYDLFIGYCSQARGPANIIADTFRNWGCKVQNWEMDFLAGRSILEEIDRMNSTCASGVFLFTKDDTLENQMANGKQLAAPRDNVVFEAGYFYSSKGKERCLLIVEKGAKVPADLGGVIYVELKDRNNVSSVNDKLENWLVSLGYKINKPKRSSRKRVGTVAVPPNKKPKSRAPRKKV